MSRINRATEQEKKRRRRNRISVVSITEWGSRGETPKAKRKRRFFGGVRGKALGKAVAQRAVLLGAIPWGQGAFFLHFLHLPLKRETPKRDSVLFLPIERFSCPWGPLRHLSRRGQISRRERARGRRLASGSCCFVYFV
jgi:hypothetical protein